MFLFDLHCDTATVLYREKASLFKNSLQISLKKAEKYEKYIELTAIFTSETLSDEEGWKRFFEVREYLLREANAHGVGFINNKNELTAADRAGGVHFIITLEDARIINERLERLRELYDAGVRVITPLWRGETSLGGAYDTDIGLSDFGKEAVGEMCALGITPDISHASRRSAEDIMDICEKYGVSPIATHMNSISVSPHPRNMTDDCFCRLVSLGGIAGISFCPAHLAPDSEKSDASYVLRHIEHFFALARNKVAFGCDFDGTTPPDDIGDISSLYRFPVLFSERGFTESEINDIFYGTALSFMEKALPD